jgi:N-ethylmaleimide reductase
VRLAPFWTDRDRSRGSWPRGGYHYTADEQTLAGYDGLVAELSECPLAYLHLRGPAPVLAGAGADVDAIAP